MDICCCIQTLYALQRPRVAAPALFQITSNVVAESPLRLLTHTNNAPMVCYCRDVTWQPSHTLMTPALQCAAILRRSALLQEAGFQTIFLTLIRKFVLFVIIFRKRHDFSTEIEIVVLLRNQFALCSFSNVSSKLKIKDIQMLRKGSFMFEFKRSLRKLA